MLESTEKMTATEFDISYRIPFFLAHNRPTKPDEGNSHGHYCHFGSFIVGFSRTLPKTSDQFRISSNISENSKRIKFTRFSLLLQRLKSTVVNELFIPTTNVCTYTDIHYSFSIHVKSFCIFAFFYRSPKLDTEAISSRFRL